MINPTVLVDEGNSLPATGVNKAIDHLQFRYEKKRVISFDYGRIAISNHH